jgi:hypothetical protein
MLKVAIFMGDIPQRQFWRRSGASLQFIADTGRRDKTIKGCFAGRGPARIESIMDRLRVAIE